MNHLEKYINFHKELKSLENSSMITNTSDKENFSENIFFSFLIPYLFFLMILSISTFVYANDFVAARLATAIFTFFFLFSFFIEIIEETKIERNEKKIIMVIFRNIFFSKDLSIYIRENTPFYKYKDEFKNIRTKKEAVDLFKSKIILEEEIAKKNKIKIDLIRQEMTEIEKDILKDEKIVREVLITAKLESADDSVVFLSNKIEDHYIQLSKKRTIEKELNRQFKKTVVLK